MSTESLVQSNCTAAVFSVGGAPPVKVYWSTSAIAVTLPCAVVLKSCPHDPSGVVTDMPDPTES